MLKDRRDLLESRDFREILRFVVCILGIVSKGRLNSLKVLDQRVFTQRRSVAKSVGCFQRRLFVCGFVNTITSEQVDVG